MEFSEEVFRAILDIMDGQQGKIESSAKIRYEMKQDDSVPDLSVSHLGDAIQRLIELGELTLIWQQQSGRVILNESVDITSVHKEAKGDCVWRSYISEDYNKRYHSGLFQTKEAAIEYLRIPAGDACDDLEKVSGLNSVYAGEISGFESYGTHTLVVRCERIHDEIICSE